MIKVWNLQTADLEARIIESRSAYIAKIKEKLLCPNPRLAPEISDIQYLARNEIIPNDLFDIKEQLQNKLTESGEREIRPGRSLVGPHRDKILIRDQRESQPGGTHAGQLRSGYYLAQMELAFESHGEYPLFLIDDVNSELDKVRIHQLVDILEAKTQIFITTTKLELIRLTGLTERIRSWHVEADAFAKSLHSRSTDK